MGKVGHYFRFAENQTTLRTEILAGTTIFFTMAYILLVNPYLLGKEAGMDFGAVFVATALAAALGTLLMGLLANYPIALAPGMGLNAYFTYTVVLGMGVSWQVALGAVFISGILFLFLTLVRLRELIINTIPAGLKSAVSAGIGLFIAFVGLKNAGIVVASEATLVQMNTSLTEPGVLLTVLGLVITVLLMIRGVKGAIFIGMVTTAIIGMITGVVPPPQGVVSLPPSVTPTLLQMDIMGALDLGLFSIIFAFLFVDLFDTAGTLVGVSKQANLLKENKLPRAGRALTADSIATMSGAALGTSTVTSYIESSAGVASGGRTGMTAVVTAAWFLLALFIFPLVETFASVAAITSPALIIVGVLMASSLKDIEWNDLTEAIPAFLTVVMMPLTFSIATGIAIGFIFYPLAKVFVGQYKRVHPILYILAILFIIRFAFGGSL
ncbi:NCS2 family permease [Mechercharimyces sp. CAU 1602]|uniref:NCS2 family permease n=1 Tax=Mechercharimyces sp. CAU 1602 TaxID=2973933 RepID=UPI002161D9C0|nr:NCS2 family permease [Mechercharimyces sp. CAU 1602]MCS1352100.1 NCS2 family permease [Mechercharimyces sp. CAU 1602]